MKLKQMTIALICCGLMLVACQEKKPAEKKMTPEQEAQVVYLNTTMVKVSVLMKMMASFARSMADDTKKAEDVDKFESEFSAAIDSIMPFLNNKFDSLKTAKPEEYKEVFMSETLQEGVKMARAPAWISGLPRLTTPFGQKEIKLYADKIMAESEAMKEMQKPEDATDPFHKKVIEFAIWSTKADSLVEKYVPLREKK
jgi:hypothetical protein